jgi:hypothetical protein
MSRQRKQREPFRVTVGFAAEAGGSGVAYAAVQGSGQTEPPRVLRTTFVCRPIASLCGRDVAYAALHAVAWELLELGIRKAEIAVDDESLPLDLAERRSVPRALILPYVALRCRLNRFVMVRVLRLQDAVGRDLSARARAEILLRVAA